MTTRTKKIAPTNSPTTVGGYNNILAEVVGLLESARRTSARSVNAVMTATYWEIGRRMVEYEQSGKKRAEYGEALLKRLSSDLTSKFGRGFSERNLEQMRLFYLGWPISQTLSAKSQSTDHRKAPHDEQVLAVIILTDSAVKWYSYLVQKNQRPVLFLSLQHR